MPDLMKLRGARTNNLKEINLDIPLKKLTVITGVSGSGKSSLAFDTLYAEGQRRYVESLSTYTRQFLEQMPKPDIDSLDNVSPSIALEQKNHINNSRSTVATMSEIYDYLRLLFAKVGKTYCLQCQALVSSDSVTSVVAHLQKTANESRIYVLAAIHPRNLKKADWPNTRKAFLMNGFERVVLCTDKNPNEVFELTTDLEKLPPRIKQAYLVIDRMAVNLEPTEQQRLADALELSFQNGNGEIAIAHVQQNKTKWKFESFSDKFRCEKCKIEYIKPEPQSFSFNSPLGACKNCSGFGFNLELDENLVVPDNKKTIQNGAIDPLAKPASKDWFLQMIKFCETHKINTGKKYKELTKKERDLLWYGDQSSVAKKRKRNTFQGIYQCFEDLKGYRYKLHIRVFIRRYQSQKLCTECQGARLRPEARAIRIHDSNIADVLNLSVEKAHTFFKTLKLNEYDSKIAKDLLKQISGRLDFLFNVGVGYLTLNRLGKTLSGGECQRINLATQLGNKLCSTLYVLDEPSIGLHPADTEKLIGLLHELRDHGNTLIVVEHDLDVMRSADHLIELGPLAGHRGGEITAEGSLKEFSAVKGCLTGKYLSGTFTMPPPVKRRPQTTKVLKIEGASENNLKNISVSFPLQQFSVVTGLSGSGKTTLIHKTLYNALAKLFRNENNPVGKFYRIYGAELLRDVVLLDQRPIGKSARSNPATYLKIWDDVRKIYANQSQAIRRGYGPKYFSFNVEAGRCPTCKGEGEITLDMHFMADIKLPCDECSGKRFKRNVLDIEFKRRNIYEIMCTTVDECIDLFREYPSISAKLQTLKNVGLGYLELGQSSTTLSGGESQRLKIASVLQDKHATNMLYIFDEPTTGLHQQDIKKLLSVLHDLVDSRNTVIVIEHNLDVIAQADWVVDLGPHGGIHGGELVAIGSPEDILKYKDSLTAKYLKPLLHAKTS